LTIALEASPEPVDSATAGQEAAAKSTDTSGNILKLSIMNDMAELEGLYATVNQLLARHKIPYRSGYAVNLAIEELVVNVIRYAYVDLENRSSSISEIRGDHSIRERPRHMILMPMIWR
jgi:hypothetical protein